MAYYSLFWHNVETDKMILLGGDPDLDEAIDRARSYRKGEFGENRTCIARVFEDLDYDAMFAMECARECEFNENFGLIPKYDEVEPEFSFKEISEISKGQVFQCEIPLMENILRF